MTCPACGGRMKSLPNVDAAECRKCRFRQTGRDTAQWQRQAPPNALDFEAFLRLPRRDGMDPDNAYVICTACGWRWNFPDMEPGDYELLPCQHGFLLRDAGAAGRAEFYGPGGDYKVTMEPPE